jgi:hypothetical protein
MMLSPIIKDLTYIPGISFSTIDLMDPILKGLQQLSPNKDSISSVLGQGGSCLIIENWRASLLTCLLPAQILPRLDF